MQLEQPAVMWRTGYREAAAPVPLQQDIQILARLKVKALNRGQSQKYLHDVGSEHPEPRDSTGERLDIDFADAGDQPRLHNQIRQCLRLAEQNVAAARFLRSDSGRDAVWISDVARSKQHTTG